MRALSLLLMPALLLAQRPVLSPADAFDRELKRNRLGTWLVLEDDGAAWGGPMRAALTDDALVELNLPVKVVAGGIKKADALAPALRTRYNWAKGAHWALVDAKGQVLAERAAAPTVATMTTAVEQAGVRSRAEELQAFLRLNPDHLEAQTALLRERMMVASVRTWQVLGPPPKPPAGAPPAEPVPPRTLDPENDLKIWAHVVQQVDRLFQGRWAESGMSLGMSLGSSMPIRSPSMAALFTRHRGEIEAALQRRPNAYEVWNVWMAASRTCGGWSLPPLLQSLQPLPGTPPGEWPPMAVLSEYLKDAKARRDWLAIREVLEPQWAIRSEDLRDGRIQSIDNSWLWGSLFGPLLEALLYLGDSSTADQVLGEAAEVAGWPGLPGQARDLATRLNRPDLAARWGALTPKGR